MIIKFTGEFTKEELMKEFEKKLDEYVPTNWTCRGSFYLNFYDEDGQDVDWIDKKTSESLKVSVQSSKKRKALSVKEIEKIKELLEQGKEPSEISDELKLANSSVKKAVNEIEELGTNGTLPILTKADFNEYMFTESELEIKKYERMSPQEVGLYKNKKGKLEVIYSFEDYFSKRPSLSLFKDMKTVPTHFIQSIYIRKYIDLSPEELSFVGLVYFEHGLSPILDAKKIFEQKGITLFENQESIGNYVEESALRTFKKNQYEGKEIGYYIHTFRDGDKTIRPVYDLESLYKEYNLRLISDDEIEKENGKTLFNPHAVHSYFPASYGVKNELEPYGFNAEGKEYRRTKRPLYEFFGLIDETTNDHYAVVPMKISKLRTLLRDNGTKLDDIKPLGMTKDYLLVYDKQSIPQEIRDEYDVFLEKKLLS